MEKELIEQFKMINRFMGKKESSEVVSNNKLVPYYGNYNTQWGELMPVVDKIVNIRYEGDDTAYLRTFGMRNHDGNFMVRFNRSFLNEASTLIQATYMAVVEFLQYYTESKKEGVNDAMEN